MQSCRRRGAWSNDEQSWAKQKGWGYWGAGLQPAVEVVMEFIDMDEVIDMCDRS